MGIYDEIDRSLYPWATRHGLHIATDYRECEVRATTIVDDAGNVYGLGLNPLTAERVLIHVGFWSKRRGDRKSETIESSLDSLSDDLERAYSVIETWISQSGNTRTPVL